MKHGLKISGQVEFKSTLAFFSEMNRNEKKSNIYLAQSRITSDDALANEPKASPTSRLNNQFLCKASDCLLYTSPSPRDRTRSRMPSSA